MITFTLNDATIIGIIILFVTWQISIQIGPDRGVDIPLRYIMYVVGIGFLVFGFILPGNSLIIW